VVTDPDVGCPDVGDVLVAPCIDPAWAPLVAIASAVVIDQGDRISHGAMLAREFGIPCVVQVAEASRRLADGLLLRVDGSRGEVRVLRDRAAARTGGRV
jgi:pyruvate,water dikinase